MRFVGIYVWYATFMNTTYTIAVGDRGRLVLPAEVRAGGEYAQGSELTLFDTGSGLVMLTREQLLARIREDLADTGDLVSELLEDRRIEAEEQLRTNPDAENAA